MRLRTLAAIRREAAVDAVRASVAREIDLSTPFILAPVALATGVALYFAAPQEPWLPAPLAVLVLFSAIALRQRIHGLVFHAACALALLAAGMAAAQLRTLRVDAPAIRAFTTAGLTGRVIETSQNRRGNPRYVIRPISIEGVETAALPRLVRLSAASRHVAFRPGDLVTGRASLQPPGGAAYPGGYDFGFFQWYDGIGATGWFLGPPRPAAAAEGSGAGLAESWQIRSNRLRMAIGERIRSGLPGEAGDLAVALINGDRSGMTEATQESLRLSGLAHILSISGLHMALVTLTVIGSVRFLLSLSPALALRHPVRKWAVGAGFAAATLYLGISGAEVATQRSYLMIAIMLFAALVDRRALTMRNVALAAIVVLLMSPEALLDPGAQMSFAAVAALVASYGAVAEWRRRRAGRRETRFTGESWPARVALHLGGLAFTSIVAGAATGLFSAWHFHRIAPWGVVANLLAIPVVSFLTMPAALSTVLLMPFGFERLALIPLGWSIEAVMAISDWVAAFPAPGVTGVQSLAVLLAGSAGIVLLTALRTRLRLLGLAPLALMFAVAGKADPPGLIVSEDGKAAAMLDGEGRLALLYPRRNKFQTDIWLRAWSGEAAGDAASLGADCGKDICRARSPGGVAVAIVYAPAFIGEACRTADVLVAPRLRWIDCDGRKPALILKRADFEARGAHVVRFEGPPSRRKFRVETARGENLRPWHAARAAPAEPVSTGGSGRRAAPAPSPGPD